MPVDNQLRDCDDRLLCRFLEHRLTAQEEAALEEHLSDCPNCRERIGDSAAGDDWWTNASRYLKHDCWDSEKADASADSSAFAAANQDAASDEIVVRQIKEWLDPTDDPQFIGRFGGYEILGMIGSGGMGVVLKGFEQSLNRIVAIKILAPALATSGAARKRFAREAQAAAAVLHENVIAIHRVADARGVPYLVMPYVNGPSLQKRIDDEGPLPLIAILRISHQIAAGLAAAHAQGLVHRDIKPANILLDRGVERVTITDFGLARAADDGSVTKTGVIAGTPQYMSPEQSRGELIDARSDLFSLGSVMYAMCTGHPPFRAETGYGVLRRITDGQPRPIREVNPDIPDWLERIVHRLLAKSLVDRFQSAEQVADLLQRCLAHLQQPTVVELPSECRPVPHKRSKIGGANRRGLVMLILPLCGLIGLACFVVVWHSPNSVDRETQKVSTTPSNSSSTSESPAAWDEPAREVKSFRDELEPFERRSQQLWDTQPRMKQE